MSNRKAEISESARLLAKALCRWDTEGGAGEGGASEVSPALPVAGALPTDALPLTNAELAHLQARVIAL